METAVGNSFFGGFHHPGLPTYSSFSSAVGGLVNGGSSSISHQDSGSRRSGGFLNGWGSYSPPDPVSSVGNVNVSQHHQQQPICNSFSPYSSSIQGPASVSKSGYSTFAAMSAGTADLLSGGNHSQVPPPPPPHAPFGHHHPLNPLPSHLSNLYVSDMYQPSPTAAATAAAGRLFSSELASLPLPPRLDSGAVSYLNELNPQSAAGEQQFMFI